jgi:hypothetical protein
MDWTYPAAAGEPGIFEIGRRLAESLGRMPDATRFTYDPRDMLKVTREIEKVCRGGRLWVGFQTTPKLEVERERYGDLLAAGTNVVAFATGPGPDGLEGLDFRSLRPDHLRLENQWFLVSDAPEPVAFVSWEVGDPAQFGVGGAASPGKRFVGFVSDDPAVVADLIATLDGVRGITVPKPTPAAPPQPGARAQDLLAEVNGIAPDASGASEGSVVVPVGRDGDLRALALALAVARSEGRNVVLVDRGAEGLLGSPYSDLRGDDEYRPHPDRLFGIGMARREGRGIVAAALEAAAALGVEAGGWFPTAAGADGLGEALRRFGGSLLVLPASTRRPGFAERLRGMSLERLGRLGAHVVVAD